MTFVVLFLIKLNKQIKNVLHCKLNLYKSKEINLSFKYSILLMDRFTNLVFLLQSTKFMMLPMLYNVIKP